MDRFWEAHDFIIKAMTSHDEPFNWEGEYFHYRQVNVWPRVWQQPHPPIWTTTGNTQARVLGERGYVMATLGSGYNTRPLYDAYRRGYLAKWGKAPGPDRFAYLGLVAVRRNDRPRRAAARIGVAGYLAARRHRASAVPQSAGLPLGRGQCADAARRDAAAQLHQGSAASSACTAPAPRI